MFLFYNVAFLGCFQYVIYWIKCWKYKKLHPDKDTTFIYSLFQKALKTMFLTVFCVCVFISVFCLELFISIIHTLIRAAFYSIHEEAGFPVPGLEDPSMGINTEGLLPVWSLEILACGGESVQFHTNTTALSVPHPLPTPVQTFTPAVLTLFTRWQHSPLSTYFSFSPSTKRHHFFKVKSFPKDKSRYNGTVTFFENSDVCKKTNRISV